MLFTITFLTVIAARIHCYLISCGAAIMHEHMRQAQRDGRMQFQRLVAMHDPIQYGRLINRLSVFGLILGTFGRPTLNPRTHSRHTTPDALNK